MRLSKFWGAVLLIVLRVATAFVTPPAIGHMTFCLDLNHFEQVMALARSMEVVVVGVLTYDITKDSYLSLFIGSILDTFDVPELSVNTVVLQVPEGSTVDECGERMLQLLPPRSIFVSFEHGVSSFGIRKLESMKQLGIGPRVVLHLNHEKPWNTADSEDMDFVYSSTRELTDAYDSHPLVMRNYYHSPLLNHSIYLPLGPSRYSFLLGTPEAEFANASSRLSSQRTTLCYFRGRLKYQTNFFEHPTRELSSGAEHIVQRRHLLALSARAGCIAETSDDNKQDYEAYRSYVERLASSAFVLCPAGNNPETFRHYEALELGAIPVLIRPPLPDRDFLQYDLWQTYPGPVLSDWSELEPLMNSMNLGEVDALQRRVLAWYARFKAQTKARTRRLLHLAMEGVSNLSEESRRRPLGSSSLYESQFADIITAEEQRQAAVGVDQQGQPQPQQLQSTISVLETAVAVLSARLAAVEEEQRATRREVRELRERLDAQTNRSTPR